MLDPKQLEARLREALQAPGEEGFWVRVEDTTGTGDHFEATVVARAFEGKSRVEQHQLVYAPFSEQLRTGELHALALKTYLPEQWRRQSSLSAAPAQKE